MGIVVDFILVFIILLNVIIGYKKGLIKVAFSIFAFLIALIATLILFKPVSYFIINNTQIDENIKLIIVSNNKFNNENQTNGEQENSESESENNKKEKENENEVENDNENEIEIEKEKEREEEKEENNTFIKKYVYGIISEKTNEAKNKAIETVADTVSVKAVEILTAIVLYIAIRIIIIFLSFLSDSIAKIPIIKQFNEVGGIVYGLLKSVIIIYLLLTIIFIVNSIKGSGFVGDAIENSYVTKYLYNNNIIVNYCLLDKNLL